MNLLPMGDKKELYRKFCSQEKELPVFLKDWWLDAACGSSGWDVAVYENAGEIYGVMPYPVRKRWGMTSIAMPRITNFIGPWIKYPPDQKYASRLSHEMEVLRELVAQLPAFSFYRQRFHYSIKNWLPFYWAKFDQTTRYSYIVQLDSLDAVFAGFKSNIRGKIRKAEKEVRVSFDFSLKDFDRLHGMTFKRQGLQLPFTFDYLQRLDNALDKNGSRKIFFAVDEQNRLHSAAYLTWDGTSSYLHMVGEDPELRNSGAGILLVWEAMKYTHTVLGLKKFDFLGSMIEPIEIVRRSFGAEQVPYFQVKKINSTLLRLLSVFRPI
jgi:lipid II:glycine glycyltransferase (peptidoglycan interpeptide bridge formation enzyme)